MFNRLTIAVTDKCNAECGICCFHCSPKNNFHFDAKTMNAVIDEAAELGGMKEIIFTGGEPLLFYDDVVKSASHAKSKGLKTAVYTNGFWGITEENANRIVAGLKNAGVERIEFSADQYHQKWIPVEDLCRAVHAVNEAGIFSEVSIMLTKKANDFWDIMSNLEGELDKTQFIQWPLLPVGRAKEKIAGDQLLKLFNPRKVKCIYNKMLHMSFDGYYHICCSTYCLDIPATKISKISETPLHELEGKVLANDFFYVMLKLGFGWYIDEAEKFGFQIPEMVSFPCECCRFIFCNSELMNKIKADVHKKAQELRDKNKLP